MGGLAFLVGVLCGASLLLVLAIIMGGDGE